MALYILPVTSVTFRESRHTVEVVEIASPGIRHGGALCLWRPDGDGSYKKAKGNSPPRVHWGGVVSAEAALASVGARRVRPRLGSWGGGERAWPRLVAVLGRGLARPTGWEVPAATRERARAPQAGPRCACGSGCRRVRCAGGRGRAGLAIPCAAGVPARGPADGPPSRPPRRVNSTRPPAASSARRPAPCNLLPCADAAL